MPDQAGAIIKTSCRRQFSAIVEDFYFPIIVLSGSRGTETFDDRIEVCTCAESSLKVTHVIQLARDLLTLGRLCDPGTLQHYVLRCELSEYRWAILGHQKGKNKDRKEEQHR
jgi:hypothetical protein